MSEQNYMESLQTVLEFLLSLEKRKIEIWEKELAELPEGTLYLAFRSQRTYYQLAIGEHRRGITHDVDLTYKLARKRYLQVLLEEQNDTLRHINELSDPSRRLRPHSNEKRSKTEELLERYAKAGLTILRITCSEKQYQWVTARFRSNPLHPEELKYETYSGIKTRSKSEQSIGNALEIRGIPYRYEMELNLYVGWMENVSGMSSSGYKNYYPDFVIPLATGEMLIWEHLGRVDLEKYRTHNMEKISAYRQNGICDDDHLILTFEKDLEKLETLGQIIARRVQQYL